MIETCYVLRLGTDARHSEVRRSSAAVSVDRLSNASRDTEHRTRGDTSPRRHLAAREKKAVLRPSIFLKRDPKRGPPAKVMITGYFGSGVAPSNDGREKATTFAKQNFSEGGIHVEKGRLSL